MKSLKKYSFIFLIVLIFVLFGFSFFNKPEEVESVEILKDLEIKESLNTIKIEIKGAVKDVGVYELDENSRIVDAVNLSGGLLKNADTSEINMSAKLVDAMIIDIPYQDIIKNEAIKVDIKGAVMNPGVYELLENARVIDVITLSGGLLDIADTSTINLSKRIFDEMVIFIPNKDENKDSISNDALIGEEQNKDNFDNDLKADDNSGSKTEEIIDKISLNTASKEQLMTLSGIGESKALAIIEYRNIKKFESIEEITNVSGIGQSLYEKIKEYITT